MLAITFLICTQLSSSFPVPLVLPTGHGAQYKADHATVAINSNLDIAVAYHARTSSAILKQVEGAYYKRNNSTDSWSYVSTSVVGSTIHDSLNLGSTPKCERPDIVSVGEYFFVTWTRRYEDYPTPTSSNHPAALECAFLKYENSAVSVINGNNPPGLGYQIDAHGLNGNDFYVKECAGVVDAFVIDDTNTTHRLGVVYPHQTNFVDSTRKFDLRIASVSINSVTDTLSRAVPSCLINNIRFEGSTGGSVGLILPDAVRGNISNEFWLTHELQIHDSSNNTTQGKIRIAYIKKNLAGGEWSPMATHVFGTSNLSILRRPMLSNHSDHPANVSIAFSSEPNGQDVDYQQWSVVNDNLVGVIPTSGHQFNNSTAIDERPIPFHSFGYRRCYFSRNGNIIYYDLDTDQETILHSSTDASRPAVAIGRQGINDYIVNTWEEGSPKRIWINIEN